MAPTTSDEFEGDDFSNNLFSDLAPLLTLFGEQVTKQFLSMSISWADNFLLAMGPLGIITIIVSTIRVGGGKKLKALIGRARESHSVAEQELLTSTSQNVCEMWSGEQIVRLIGNGDDMETCVVTRDGEISDLRTATAKNYAEYSENGWTMKQLLHQKSLSPNLTLNVQGATASALELWACAMLGTLLQFFSIAFAGAATHYWKWTKSGVQVPGYGYPCFCAGTTCLIISIIACGHVIERVTDELTWCLTTEEREQGFRILTLQRAHTVGDQYFPSCAIFMTGDDGLLKFSRLNKKDYRLLVTISTSLAVVGYIIQFVGLRALHWSATIAQLGVTLVMTAIRAWVRRGLASDPDWHPLIEGHEVACLALLIHSNQSDLSTPSRRRKRTETAKDHNNSSVETVHPHCELLLGYVSNGEYGFYSLAPGFIKIFQPSRGPLETVLDVRPSDNAERTYAPLKIFSRISKGIPLSSIDREIAAVSNTLTSVIQSVMDALDISKILLWKAEASEPPSERVATDFISWGFDIRTTRVTEDGNHATSKIHFRLQRSTNHAQHLWSLLDRDLISALLSMSALTLTMRLEALHQVTSQEKQSIGDELFFVGHEIPCHPSSSARIVGYVANEGSLSDIEMLEDWLDADIIFQRDLERFISQRTILGCYLGMFLSSASSTRGWVPWHSRDPVVKELVIQTRRDSGLFLQWAQELFSIFMLAIASKAERVLGETEEAESKRGEGKRCLKNSAFDTIADVVVNKGLAHDRDEAYTLIVPAFAHHGLLPICSNEQAGENTSERPASRAPSDSEENTP